jgi:hypothetical protein
VSAVSAPYHPGQSPWPDNQSQRPDRPPPIQFRQEEQEPGGSPVLAWTLRIAGLVAIAVISGLVWWYIQKEAPNGSAADDGGSTGQQSSGAFEFTPVIGRPQVDDNCADHAYGATQDSLQQTPCERLTRSVFTTEIDGRTVYVSVSVVEMADEAAAKALRELTDSNDTGNVSDLVREKVVDAGGLDELSGADGYDSEQKGSQVVIIEADYAPDASDGGAEDELDKVCKDALRLGKEIVADAG